MSCLLTKLLDMVECSLYCLLCDTAWQGISFAQKLVHLNEGSSRKLSKAIDLPGLALVLKARGDVVKLVKHLVGVCLTVDQFFDVDFDQLGDCILSGGRR